MSDSKEYIFNLIAARLCGEELTAEEASDLETWRKAEPGNEELFNYYQSIFVRKNHLQLWESVKFSPEKCERVFRSRRVVRKRLSAFARYAAVLLPIVVGACWFLLRDMKHSLSEPVPIIAKADFAPGKQKARLQLENGEVVVLSDSSMAIASHQNIQVENGGVLEYAGADRSEELKAVYHTLVVDRGAEFQLLLPDGTKVWLNSDSELKYPNVFNEETRQVYLKGEAYFEVRHAASHPFIVHAGECAIRVLGTSFNISSYEDTPAVVTTLINGKVTYSAGTNNGELTPGEQCIYDRSGKTVKVYKVDVNQYISWKNGLFVFDHIRMEDLAKQISRWYDVKVVFPDESARQISFTGAMERYKSVSYLIQLLNETNTVNCKLEGGMLVFRTK